MLTSVQRTSTMIQAEREENKQTKDLFMVSTNQLALRNITDLVFRLNGHYLKRLAKKQGKSKALGDQCEYHLTILAEQMQENLKQCPNTPSKIISGFNKGGGMQSASLCEQHFEAFSRWADKQPDMY